MIFLSHWATSRIRESGNVPALTLDYPRVTWRFPDDKDTTAARVPVEVTAPPNSLLNDFRYPFLALGVPVDLEDYRDGLRACHDMRLCAWDIRVQVAGVSYLLPASVGYQKYLSDLREEFRAGMPSQLLRTADIPRPVSAAVFFHLFNEYRSALRNNAGRDEFDTRGQIESAKTRSALDSITIS